MRIRRTWLKPIVGGSPVQLNPVKASIRSQFLDPSNSSRRNVLPSPTENAADHPATLKHPNGLDKYSTGVITLTGLLRKRSLLNNITLKLYGRAPFRRTGILQVLSHSLESTPAAADLQQRLAQLAKITYDVWNSSTRFRDVYFQVFGLSAKRRGLGSSIYMWNLVCQLYRENRDAPPSKTLFELGINPVVLGRRCQIKGERLASLDSCELQITLQFYLKRQAHAPAGIPLERELKSRVESDRTGDVLQDFVDRLVQRVYELIRGKIFANVDEAIGTMQNGILAYLTDSPLRDSVDFIRIQNTFKKGMGVSQERIAHDRLLNADGSPQPAPADLREPFSDQETAEIKPELLDLIEAKDENALPNTSAGSYNFYHLVSETTREKIGFSKFLFGVSSESGIALAARESVSKDLRDEFDRICQDNIGNGLACFASAAVSLGMKFPKILSAIQPNWYPVKLIKDPDLPYPPTITLGFNNRTGLVESSISSQRTLAFSLTGSSEKIHRTVSWIVLLNLLPPEEVSEFAGKISADAEYKEVTQMVETITQTLCREIQFGSHQEMCDYIAEALLRHVRFPTTGARPESARFIARFKAEPKGLFRIVAEKTRKGDFPRTSNDTESQTGSVEPVMETMQLTEASDTPQLAIEEASENLNGVSVQPEVSTAVNDSAANLDDEDEPFGRETAEDNVVQSEGPGQDSLHPTARIFIGLGSNLGDRLENIEKACREIDGEPDMRVVRTSALYETAPMYVEDQARFLNGACEIETTLSPIDLLDKLQAIEQRLGRVKTIDKGPRNIDLDVLLYQSIQIQTERLTIPHPLLREREFVLRPLCDIPTARKQAVVGGRYRPRRIVDHLRGLPKTEEPMYAMAPLASRGLDIRLGDPASNTRIMSILNMTPDSFSDGGVYQTMEAEKLAAFAKAQIAAGASIIDIGGQSSRPNAPDVSAEDEIARILPAIEAVKSLPEAANVAISIDTYRAAVAEAAVKAGAHIVNDISAGLLDAEMLPTVARLGCTYIMMHMRGTPTTMMSAENCAYPEGLIPTIAREMWERRAAAEAAGIRSWRIILDPGIGFSKTAEQNLEILRDFRRLKGAQPNHAWLIGSSRKSFIGKVTGVEEPKERAWGSAAAVTMAIQGGAHIVRVHDAEETNAVVKMADAVYHLPRIERQGK